MKRLLITLLILCVLIVGCGAVDNNSQASSVSNNTIEEVVEEKEERVVFTYDSKDYTLPISYTDFVSLGEWEILDYSDKDGNATDEILESGEYIYAYLIDSLDTIVQCRIENRNAFMTMSYQYCTVTDASFDMYLNIQTMPDNTLQLFDGLLYNGVSLEEVENNKDKLVDYGFELQELNEVLYGLLPYEKEDSGWIYYTFTISDNNEVRGIQAYYIDE